MSAEFKSPYILSLYVHMHLCCNSLPIMPAHLAIHGCLPFLPALSPWVLYGWCSKKYIYIKKSPLLSSSSLYNNIYIYVHRIGGKQRSLQQVNLGTSLLALSNLFRIQTRRGSGAHRHHQRLLLLLRPWLRNQHSLYAITLYFIKWALNGWTPSLFYACRWRGVAPRSVPSRGCPLPSLVYVC